MPRYPRIFTTLLMLIFISKASAQLLSVKQVTSYAVMQPENIGAELQSAGWKVHEIQFVPDSNFVKRTWVIPYKGNDLKMYLIHYEFTNDTNENYISYQFSDRSAFMNYKKELKALGYKHINGGKSRKRSRAKDQHIHKEKEDLFYDEKRKTLTVVKEVFYYGLFSFLIYSYKPNSAIAEHVMHPKVK